MRASLFTILMCILFASPAFTQNLKIPASSSFAGKSVNLSGEFKSVGKLRPTVILLHGCGGLRGAVRSSLRSHASALASAGFSTLILDSFTPRKIPVGQVCLSIKRLAAARSYRQQDVRDAARYLVSQGYTDARNIFILDQSNGGSVVSLLAKRPFKGLRGAVAYYPWCGIVPANPKVLLLVLSGKEDDWTPPAQCVAKDRKGGRLSVITYPDAVHSFDLNISVRTFQGHKVGRNSKASADARRRMVRWFRTNLR